MGRIIVNAVGEQCPIPVVKASRALRSMTEPGVLEVHVDNEIAVQNLTRFAEHKGFGVSAEKKADKEYAVIMTVSGAAAEETKEAEIACVMDSRRKGMLVVLSGNTMGSGDPKLGTSLMKAFLFALTKQDQLPDTILCYNTGAYLTCEGADTLEDLKLLESEGVTILTCGTCLDFYGLKEKLAVGGVTNMYDIVERMENAAQIIKP